MASAERPIRILTAVPLCDGHDSAINTINLELIHHGIEVVYLGYNRSVRDIVRAAIQEDVRAVGISSYNGGHVEFFSAVVKGLRAEGAADIAVFGGGGGTITRQDAALLRRRGVDRVFFPGETLAEIVDYIKTAYGSSPPPALAVSPPPVRRGRATVGAPPPDRVSSPDRILAKALTTAELSPKPRRHLDSHHPLVIGVTGPGGAGKTTLIDELVLRFFNARPDIRIAILSHDPSIIGNGALLGDRATMVYSQHDRVFMRSIGTRGQSGGLSPPSLACLNVLKHNDVAPFDIVFVETIGTGQEAMPFPPGAVDRTVLVMSPDYGSRLQLQKIATLDLADIVVINKSDLPAAKTASSEIQSRLDYSGRKQALVTTIAKRHRHSGVDDLFAMLSAPAESARQMAVAHA